MCLPCIRARIYLCCLAVPGSRAEKGLGDVGGKDRNPDKYQSFGISHRPKSEDGVVLPSCGGPRPPAIASLPPHTGNQRSYICSGSSSDRLPAWQCITLASRPHWQYPWQTQQCVSSIYFFSPNGTSVYARSLPSLCLCLSG